MKKRFLFIALVPLLVYSQKWNERKSSAGEFEGISIGFLVQGQTKYPNPYYGPEVTGLFNDGAYHLTFDLYFSKFVVGVQFTDEFLYLQKIESDGVWKPRGFNGSYSSLTRSYWLTAGYEFMNTIYFKLGAGFRSGPQKQILGSNTSPSEVALGYNFSNAESIFNTNRTLNSFSEWDYSLSVTYPIAILESISIVPELGYTIKHGGVFTGFGILF